MSLTRAKERATGAGDCRRVSESVPKYSVQYKGYNLIGVTTVEGWATRGMTALVYYSIHSSLYTGTVHCVQGHQGTRALGYKANWFDRQPGAQKGLHSINFWKSVCHCFHHGRHYKYIKLLEIVPCCVECNPYGAKGINLLFLILGKVS